MKNDLSQDSELNRQLSTDAPGSRKRWWKLTVGLSILAVIVAVVWTSASGRSGQKAASAYKTEPARRGALVVTVSATGNLEPTNQVDVGTEISGTIKTVLVAENDEVAVGQVLAELDTARLQAQNAQSRASLAAAKAKVLQIEATIAEARSQLARLTKVQQLSNAQAVSQSDMDTAQAALARAVADKAAAEAAVAQAQATLDIQTTDLAKAVIRSPINGIVLTRSVEPGQTVAASLQAPVLFTLAEDLAHMQLRVDVDEADVGQVKADQPARFTVDAYPDRTYSARILKVNYGSKTTEGVVTYETLLSVDNADLSLRPGMTATADITVRQLDDVLLVPNAALRWSPPADRTDNRRSGLVGMMLPRPPQGRRQETREKTGGNSRAAQRVWTLQDNHPVQVTLSVGSTDGTWTEVTAGEIAPQMPLIVDVQRVTS